MEITEGGLLGNRLRYYQPASGYRTGIEPVLLAAAVPARSGEAVLEAGAGAGAGLLCLAARVPGLRGMALECDPDLAALAAQNLAENGFVHCRAIAAHVAQAPSFGPFAHAFANPPWHDPAGTPSPLPTRNQAKRADAGLPDIWAQALAGALQPRGTLTLILPPASLPAWLAALGPVGFGGATLRPLWPLEGRPAKLVLLAARRGARGAFQVLPGITLHAEGKFTAQAQAILRHGQALPP